MKHFFQTYTFISPVITAICFFAITTVVHTQNIVSQPQILLQHVPQSVAQQQQFYIDVAIDTHGTAINGIQGSLSFSGTTLSFVRAETGTSNITLWVDNPTLKGNTIGFSGIIPGGFNGLVNPFDQNRLLPGSIVRLVFVGQNPGSIIITTSHVSVTRNDGSGTLQPLDDTVATAQVSTATAPSLYTTPDTIPPTLTASVISDQNLFNGNQTLLFIATDKESGIARVQVQEGSEGGWNNVDSPYMLHDQLRKGILSIRAYDVAGNVTNFSISPLTTNHSSVIAISILIFIAFIILYVIYKKTAHHKNNINR
jgi:hypothetical protein